MQVVNESGLSIGWCVSRVPPHKLTATCIVKGTFSLKHGEVAQALPEQPSLNADVHEDDNIEKMLLVPGDFAHFKPACDVLLTGTCYARGGKAAPLERVSFGVGRWEKSLMVVGDRNWQPGLLGAKMTDPAPFVSMPLGFDRAYGGPGFSPNPFGRGFAPVDKDLVAGKHPLPNLENPNQQISAPSSRPAPASFGPIPAIWLARAGKGGTYDKKWLKQNWPFFPDNFDWSFFNYAPPDQQLKEFPKGDETLRMRQMHPTIAIYEAKLPGIRPRFFLREHLGAKLEFREAILQLDTIHVDMNKEQLTLVWRGVAPVSSKRMIEVKDVLVVSEPLGKPPAPAANFERMLKREEPAPTPEKVGPREHAGRKEAEQLPKRVAKIMVAAQTAAKNKSLSPKLLKSLTFLAAALEPHSKEKPPAKEKWTRERVLAAKAGELVGADLAYLDLSGAKLTGANLAAAVLTFANLAKADLSGADLGAAILADANLAGANFSGAKLAAADLVHANLSASNLSGANLTGADLSLADGKGANFEKASAAGALFISANFEGAKFKGAELANADFSESRVPKADFEGANLAAATFELCDASDAVFVNSHCKQLKAGRGANFSRAKFIGAKAPAAAFHESRLDGADFKDADLSRAFFDGASLAGVNLAGVNAPGSRFDHTTLKGATIARAHLHQASFENANLTDADFRGANLFEAEFMDASGGTAKHFEGANIKRTKLA
ncbi:MAG: DUF2169 domain-containing protein [Planctomycetes bacterium]|nr:DUF2169 domain-containing protein [Planctomycetota bacterium]